MSQEVFCSLNKLNFKATQKGLIIVQQRYEFGYSHLSKKNENVTKYYFFAKNQKNRTLEKSAIP